VGALAAALAALMLTAIVVLSMSPSPFAGSGVVALLQIGFAAIIAATLAAAAAAWVAARPVIRRAQAILDVATRYDEGDLTRPTYDYGDDELGSVARGLDAAVQGLGRRIGELRRDRARMEAVLAAWSRACSWSIGRADSSS